MDERGFTIIEFVLVIMVAAIIAAVAVPQFGRYWDGIKVSNAAMKIASDIRYAQNRTTTTQQRSQVNFAAGGQSYAINSCAIADYASSTCTCAGAGWTTVKTIDFTLSGSVEFSFSGVVIAIVPGNCIEFDSLGKPYYNTNCSNPAVPCPSTQTIPPFNVQYGSSSKTINVMTQTGMVQVN